MAHAKFSKVVYSHIGETSEKQPDREERVSRMETSLLLLYGLLFLGLAFALGHHFLYNSLDGRPVETVLIPQSWTLRIGTLLAFLVKLCFGASMGVAYVQLQWLVMRQHDVKIKDVDVISNILNNAFNFFDSRIWYRVPYLTVVAVLWWLLILVPIITPGTLTAYSSQLDTTSDMKVPQLDFNNSARKYLASGILGWVQEGNMSGSTRPADPYESSLSLTQLMYAVAIGGQPLPVLPPAANSSYRLDFTGPAVKCTPANEAIVANMTGEFGIHYPIGPISSADHNTIYLAQAGSSYQPLCFLGRSRPRTNCQNTSSISTLDDSDRDAWTILIMSNTVNYTGVGHGNDLLSGTSLIRVNVTECVLWNASYTVDFSFQYPNQSVEVKDVQYLNTVSAVTGDQDVNRQHYDRMIADSYSAMMLNMAHLLVGLDMEKWGAGNDPTMMRSLLNIDWNGLDSMQAGLEQLFQNMTLGLFGREEFLKNESSVVSVVVTTYPTTYHYASRDLFVTYGLAMLTTLLSSMASTYAIRKNKGSYQNNCSTFIRAGAGCMQVLKDDDNGLDPCPEDLAGMPLYTKSSSRSASVPLPVSGQRLIPRKPVSSHSQRFLRDP